MPIENDLAPNASPLDVGNAKLRWEMAHGNGKGDAPRAVRGDAYRSNWDRIFRAPRGWNKKTGTLVPQLGT